MIHYFFRFFWINRYSNLIFFVFQFIISSATIATTTALPTTKTAIPPKSTFFEPLKKKRQTATLSESQNIVKTDTKVDISDNNTNILRNTVNV